MCTSLQVTGEMLSVFNHVAVLFVCFFYSRKMSLAGFWCQIDFACGCPDADEL